uniref:Reverse transcriptase domain-containing protein n=1 Tax=Acrobeloides nanus TaxID=290746 RepID=A0A914CN35_9BILA
MIEDDIIKEIPIWKKDGPISYISLQDEYKDGALRIHRGPVLLPDSLLLLIRMRLFPYLVTSDVQRAFWQIVLRTSSRDATRFIWLKDFKKGFFRDNIVIYRSKRLPFGHKSSPFVLSISIKFHLHEKYPQFEEELSDNTNVDNVFIISFEELEALLKSFKYRDIFNDIKMNLRNFLYNSSLVMAKLDPSIVHKSKIIKLLGILWEGVSDSLILKVTPPSHVERYTKRVVLSGLARQYDPTGVLGPVFVSTKLFLHSLWVDKIGWMMSFQTNEPCNGKKSPENGKETNIAWQDF